MIGESSADLRYLPTPLTAEPRALARRVSSPHARLLGDAPGSRVWTVKRAGKVRLAVPIPWPRPACSAQVARSSATYGRL